MNAFSADTFSRIPLIGILRGYGKEQIHHILETYILAGLSTIEITWNTPHAADIIGESVERYGRRLNIGAGTVCSEAHLDQALACGAQYIVTPVLNLSVISRCKELGVPIFPGAYTPSEIYSAWEAGATMVKVFPAGCLGPDYIQQVKAPLDTIQLLPTGGIKLENMEAYLKAGANGFGLGSALFPDRFIHGKDWDGLKKHLERFVSCWEKAGK